MSQPALNYAEQYQRTLVQAFPYVLNFGALYATTNNGRFKWIDAKTIKIPSLATTGRVDADRDTIAQAQRNYSNEWTSLTLSNERKWSTLVHPMDIDQTNQVASIANITQTFNEFQKFPEMDAYCISKIYSDWTAQDMTADTTEVTVDNILTLFDKMMLAMNNKRVPVQGRILYVTNEIKSMLKVAIKRTYGNGEGAIDRDVDSFEGVQIVAVPSELMKTAYDFTEGWKASNNAKQINMVLIHPNVIITPVSYTFSRLDEPSAGSEGKYVYYEESFEDVFILNKQKDGIQFCVEA